MHPCLAAPGHDMQATQRIIHIKKGQFASADVMVRAADKVMMHALDKGEMAGMPAHSQSRADCPDGGGSQGP